MSVSTKKPKATKARKDTVINLRLPAQMRDLLDEAAEALGKTRTQFVVDSAHAQALDVLLDKRIFKLSGRDFTAFLKALDRPTKANDALKALLKSKAPWAS
ncbi:DUF1778 domain-containing protein [Aestuariivirga sp.]|uniref:type II toxin-antitoxin system TacA family antitoxin n=1 Tax=Aestuariivirga sp. TaxID=2650926 RepID=UPI0039E353CA